MSDDFPDDREFQDTCQNLIDLPLQQLEGLTLQTTRAPGEFRQDSLASGSEREFVQAEDPVKAISQLQASPGQCPQQSQGIAMQNSTPNASSVQDDALKFALKALKLDVHTHSRISYSQATTCGPDAQSPGFSWLLETLALLPDDARSKVSDPALHPTDVLLAVFLVCDAELRQFLCRRLFESGRAFPCAFVNNESLTVTLWCLRDVAVESDGQKVGLVAAGAPVVCFARAGQTARSKSRFLNLWLTGNSTERPFVHWHSVNDICIRRISSGVVEAAVRQPGHLNDRPVLALNLRGDLTRFEKQRRLLADVSHATVVFAEAESLQEDDVAGIEQLLDCHQVLLVTGAAPDPARLGRLYGRIDVVSFDCGNEARVKSHIDDWLNQCLSSPSTNSRSSKNLKDLHTFLTDERCQQLKDAQSKAVEVKDSVEEMLGRLESVEDLTRAGKSFVSFVKILRTFVECPSEAELQSRLFLQSLRLQLEESPTASLESLLGRMGRAFELIELNSSSADRELKQLKERLPDLLARLLLWGIPLELLAADRDAAIPWLHAVLSSCQRLTDAKRLLVVSVLGARSSNVSLFVNGVFGLRNSTACGASLRVCKASGQPFDFVAIVDATKCESQEVALAVADVAVVGVGSESSQLLEVVASTLLRLQLANQMKPLHKKCIFVVESDGCFSQQSLRLKLDEVAENVAESWRIRQSIDFDCLCSATEIFVAPSLRCGLKDLSWAIKAREVKPRVLECPADNLGDFEEFCWRIHSAWKAAKSADFVQSYKEFLEMLSSRRLKEAEFSERITRERHVELWVKCKAEVELRRNQDANGVRNTYEDLKSRLTPFVMREVQEADNRLRKFLKDDELADFASASQKEKLLDSNQKSATVLIEKHGRQLDEIFLRTIKAIEVSDELRKEERLLKGVPSNCNQQALEKAFDEKFKALVDRLKAAEWTKERIEEVMLEWLQSQDHGNEWDIVKQFVSQESRTHKSVHRGIDLLKDARQNEFYRIKRKWRLIKARAAEEEAKAKETLASECDDLLRQMRKFHRRMASEEPDFSKRRGADTLAHFRASFESLTQRLQPCNVEVTQKLATRLLVASLWEAAPQLAKVDKEFRQRYSVEAQLRRREELLRNAFVNESLGTSTEKLVAHRFLDHVLLVAKEAIDERMTIPLKAVVAKEIGCCQADLSARMLSDWAEQRNFIDVMNYARNGRSGALKWLTGFTETHLFDKVGAAGSQVEETRFSQVIKAELIEPIVECVKQAVRCAASESNFNAWIDQFCKQLKEELPVLPQHLSDMCDAESFDDREVVGLVVTGLHDFEHRLVDWYRRMTSADVAWQSERLNSEVLDSLWGCGALCPFCGEPCRMSAPDHFEADGTPHTCVCHRPVAVNGWHASTSEELLFDVCGFFISSDWKFYDNRSSGPRQSQHFREYRHQIPDWDIPNDIGSRASEFWQWFCCEFESELKDKYTPFDTRRLPSEWREVSKRQALASLRDLRQSAVSHF